MCRFALADVRFRLRWRIERRCSRRVRHHRIKWTVEKIFDVRVKITIDLRTRRHGGRNSVIWNRSHGTRGCEMRREAFEQRETNQWKNHTRWRNAFHSSHLNRILDWRFQLDFTRNGERTMHTSCWISLLNGRRSLGLFSGSID